MSFGSPCFAERSNSSAGTPALARCAAICAPMTPAPRMAAFRTRMRDSGMFRNFVRVLKKRRAAGCDAAARTANLDALPRLLGRVGQLEADDVDIAPVRPADQTVGGGASVVLIHVGIADEDVRPGEVDRQAGREPVLRAERNPGPVIVREPRRPLRVANGRLIVG